ncbi:uncharacterized protein FYW47_002390 [Aplochiton taeniatus]
MDVDSLLSFSSLSSLTEEDASDPNEDLPPQSTEEHESTEQPWPEEVAPMDQALLSKEEQVTLITESMSVTSADQEKLLLLNKNTELRRVNNELMRLNEEWDAVYRTATLGLQRRVQALAQDSAAIKQLNNRLLLKVEHEQSAKEYYEHTLMQELKRNTHLQEYIRTLESRLHHKDTAGDWTVGRQTDPNVGILSPDLIPSDDAPGGPTLNPQPCVSTASNTDPKAQGRNRSSRAPCGAVGEASHFQAEVHNLKEQLGALQCQTQIYEADYQTEHKDHKQTLQENRRLRNKREEMRQQMILLQEQLKVYEDDFRKERSDKQVLQRLLLKKTQPTKDPVLVHRCNIEDRPPGGDKRQQIDEQRVHAPHRQRHHPLCPKHYTRNSEELP